MAGGNAGARNDAPTEIDGFTAIKKGLEASVPTGPGTETEVLGRVRKAAEPPSLKPAVKRTRSKRAAGHSADETEVLPAVSAKRGVKERTSDGAGAGTVKPALASDSDAKAVGKTASAARKPRNARTPNPSDGDRTAAKGTDVNGGVEAGKPLDTVKKDAPKQRLAADSPSPAVPAPMPLSKEELRRAFVVRPLAVDRPEPVTEAAVPSAAMMVESDGARVNAVRRVLSSWLESFARFIGMTADAVGGVATGTRRAVQRVNDGYTDEELWTFGPSMARRIGTGLVRLSESVHGRPPYYGEEKRWFTQHRAKAERADWMERNSALMGPDGSDAPYVAWREDLLRVGTILIDWSKWHDDDSDEYVDCANLYGRAEADRRLKLADDSFTRAWAWIGENMEYLGD